MYFGTIDSFERKLDHVQRELDIPLANRVSVTYVVEFSVCVVLFPHRKAQFFPSRLDMLGATMAMVLPTLVFVLLVSWLGSINRGNIHLILRANALNHLKAVHSPAFSMAVALSQRRV